MGPAASAVCGDAAQLPVSLMKGRRLGATTGGVPLYTWVQEDRCLLVCVCVCVRARARACVCELHCGMCWLRSDVTSVIPSMSCGFHSAGISLGLR